MRGTSGRTNEAVGPQPFIQDYPRNLMYFYFLCKMTTPMMKNSAEKTMYYDVYYDNENMIPMYILSPRNKLITFITLYLISLLLFLSLSQYLFILGNLFSKVITENPRVKSVQTSPEITKGCIYNMKLKLVNDISTLILLSNYRSSLPKTTSIPGQLLGAPLHQQTLSPHQEEKKQKAKASDKEEKTNQINQQVTNAINTNYLVKTMKQTSPVYVYIYYLVKTPQNFCSS